MSIQAFIQDEILLPRLRQNGALVIYDPAQRYRTLCLALASDMLRVVDATVAFDEVSGIKVKDPDTIQIMKDYMANGCFSRGVDIHATRRQARGCTGTSFVVTKLVSQALATSPGVRQR
jgi:hypothetical protein